MPYSAGIVDPIGHVLAYVPVALALLGAAIALLPALLLSIEALAHGTRGRRSHRLEPAQS